MAETRSPVDATRLLYRAVTSVTIHLYQMPWESFATTATRNKRQIEVEDGRTYHRTEDRKSNV